VEGPELVLGTFELRGTLGRGAMAVVWRAYDVSLDREVAIKEPSLPPGGDVEVREEFARRFVREARAAARLNHPGIVTIYSASLDEGRPLIVMELVEGPTLRRVLDTQRLTPSQTYALLEQLLEATAFAHEHGVIHRDLKPDNVFVTPGGTVKLADFGIAHLGDGGTTLTSAGTLLGTPAYMAPEQIRGEPVDARCDLFALGVIAYECLAGENPFGSSTTSNYAAIFHRILDEPAPPLELDDEAAMPLIDIVMRALSKDREDRFADASEMLAAWRAAFTRTNDTNEGLAELSDAAQRPVSPGLEERKNRRTGSRLARRKRRRLALLQYPQGLVLIGVVALAVVLAVLAVVFLVPRGSSGEQQTAADARSAHAVLSASVARADAFGAELDGALTGYAAILWEIESVTTKNVEKVKAWNHEWKRRQALYDGWLAEAAAHNNDPANQSNLWQIPDRPLKPPKVHATFAAQETELEQLQSQNRTLAGEVERTAFDEKLATVAAALTVCVKLLEQEVDHAQTVLNKAIIHEPDVGDVISRGRLGTLSAATLRPMVHTVRERLLDIVTVNNIDPGRTSWVEKSP
jgi:hypothetical protein